MLSPNCVCWVGLPVYVLASSKLDQTVSRRPQVWTGLSGGQRICAGIYGDLQVWEACGMSVWVHTAGPARDLGTRGGSKIWAVVLGGQKECG